MDDNLLSHSTWLGPLSEVASGLAARAGYAPERALVIAREISRLDKSLHQAFRDWWSLGGTPDEPVILGYSPRRLIENGRCRSIPVTFTWLNALLTDPCGTQERMHASYDIVSDDPEADLGHIILPQ